MSATASDYQSLKLQIKGLEEIVAELKRDNVEKVKIIAAVESRNYFVKKLHLNLW